jgi:phosphoglucomutase
VLNKQNAASAVIVKTFVTTDLQNAVADRYGVRCVETLTGFKYRREAGTYGERFPNNRDRVMPISLVKRGNFGSHTLHLRFPGEESYGYSARILFATRTATQ